MSENHTLFELTKEHIALICAIKFNAESLSVIGNTDSNITPFGGLNLRADLGDILIGREPSEIEKAEMRANGEEFKCREDVEWMEKIYKELPTALDIVCYTRSFEPGIYRTRWYERNWTKTR